MAINKAAQEDNINAGTLISIGSLQDVEMGFYREGKYTYVRKNGPFEIVSCLGTIARLENGEVAVHAHIVVSDESGAAFGGHLMKGSHVGVTAELILIEALDVALVRSYDEKTKLNLLRTG